jgi:hypothetical protein
MPRPDDHLPGLVSAAVVFGLFLLLPAALAIWAAIRGRRLARLARQADASFALDAPLELGPAVLCGTVELGPGEPVAVRVEIDQLGSEQREKQAWSHVWTERHRTLTHAPFYLRDLRGQTIRVEPDDELLLIDTPDGTRTLGHTARIRIVELSPGEQIYAAGELVRARDPLKAGYRGQGEALVLRRSSGERLTLSTDPLGKRFHSRARIYNRFALLLGAFAVAAQVAFADHHARLLLAEPASASVVYRELRSGKGSHCGLELVTARGQAFSERVDSSWCSKLRNGEQILVLEALGFPWLNQVGVASTVGIGRVVLIGVLLGSILFWFALRERPWYEAPLVESGPGRLPSPSIED